MKIEAGYTQFMLYGKTERGYATETQAKIREVFTSWLQPTFREREVESITRLEVMQLRNLIALERLVRIAVILDAVGPLGGLFAPPPAATLAELERAERRRVRAPARRRGSGDA